MRYFIIAVLSCALGAGCGGGGAPLPPGGGGPSPNAQNALATLQACAPDSLTSLLDSLGVIQALSAGTQANVTFQGIDNVGKTVGFTIDLDNDGQPDLLGGMGFDDGQGQPANVDLSPLQSQGIAGLPTVLGTMPDGAVLQLDLNNTTGTSPLFMTITFQSGLPTTADGRAELLDPLCQSIYTMTGVSAAGLLLSPPNVALEVEMINSSHTLLGTVTFDGTDVVRFDVRIDDLEDVSFTYDLQSGQFVDVTGT